MSMLDLDLRFLGAVSTQGVLNITRPEYTVSWSRNNQVALVTDGGGVHVVDFVHTHEEIESETSGFTGSETNIPCSKPKDADLENYTGIPLSRILSSREKTEIFDIVRDSILTPKELTNAEVHLYFTKISWSQRPLKLKSTNEGKFQYVLGALDSHFKLRLFIRRPPQDDELEGLLEEDDWKVCVDFTESYRNLLISQFWRINVENEASFSGQLYNEYKQRMYELATVDFVWLPAWEEPSDYHQLSEGDLLTSLITCHASGDICIWNLCVSLENEPKFYLTLEFRRNLVPDEIVRSMNFYKLSSSLGILVIGTTQGSVRVFRVTYQSTVARALKTSRDDEPQPQKYFLDNGILLWDQDLMEIQNTCVIRHGECDEFEEGMYRINLYIFKHPNFVIPFELDVSDDEISINRTFAHSRIVQGVLTGALVADESQNLLMTITQRGVLSWIRVKDGVAEQVVSHDLSQLEDDGGNGGKLGSTKKRLQFGGLIVSPNKAMICTSKTLAEYYNHLALRTPSVLQFHSLFPSKNVWQFVYDKFVENKSFLHRMTDVLTGYRVIMVTSEQHCKEVFDWAVPLREKSLQDLQILFWFLRVQPRVDRDQLQLTFNLKNEQPLPFLELKFKQIRLIRREALVLDRIMQIRCRTMIDKIVENPDEYELEGNVTNLQSLMIMYDFLETKIKLEDKALPMKPRVLIDPPPRKPACPLCGKPTKLLQVAPPRWRKDHDFTVEHEIDNEEFDGVLWHEQQHIQKSRPHPITNCILSLIPAAYPYRKCSLCGTICMLTPVFNQEPICPLCNGLMEPPSGFYTDDELEEGGEAVEAIVQQAEEQRLSEARASGSDSLSIDSSRRSRVDHLYV